MTAESKGIGQRRIYGALLGLIKREVQFGIETRIICEMVYGRGYNIIFLQPG